MDNVKQEVTEAKAAAKVPENQQGIPLENSVFIGQQEAAAMLNCSISTVSACFKEVTKRMKAAGLFTMRGRVNRRMFYEYVGYEAKN